MRCRYCNIALAPLRNLASDEFCCDEHRDAFHEQQDAPEAHQVSETEPDIPVTPLEPAFLRRLRLKFSRPPLSIAPRIAQPIAQPIPQDDEADLAASEAPTELAFSEAPQLPALEEPAVEQSLEFPVEEFEPTYAFESNAGSAGELYESAEELDPSAETSGGTRPHTGVETAASWREAGASWRWIRKTWKGAPRDLKLVTVVLPILAAMAVTGSFPKVPIQTVVPPAQMAQVEKVVTEHWKNLNQTISNRAAVSYADDFRSGLDAWESRSNRTTNWSYDATGFVLPGPLALYKPTLDLVDYRFEFLGEIDQRAMGWVFRAEDLNNYYAMKFVVVKPGPLPLVDMVRYAVINGREGPHVRKPLPITVRTDMLYRVMVDVRGADFTVMTQGQVVDFWTDHRLQHGGVGFFANRGERARLRWVEVSHQYDALGRVCAYLVPYGIEGKSGLFN
jgi:hypothetical protein